jgi:hypothetical protein
VRGQIEGHCYWWRQWRSDAYFREPQAGVLKSQRRKNGLVLPPRSRGLIEKPIQAPAMESACYDQTLDVHSLQNLNHKMRPFRFRWVDLFRQVLGCVGIEAPGPLVEMVGFLADPSYRLNSSNRPATEQTHGVGSDRCTIWSQALRLWVGQVLPKGVSVGLDADEPWSKFTIQGVRCHPDR